MKARALLPAAAASAALALPALALGDGIPPHSSLYGSQRDAIGLVVHRDTHRADVHVRNACLGIHRFGTVKVAYIATATVRVRNGRVAYAGRAKTWTGTTYRRVPMVFRARITARRAVGTVGFPRTRCGTLHFTARLRERTP